MSTVSSTSRSRSEISEQQTSQQAEKDRLRSEHESDMERIEKAYDSETQDLRDRFETGYQEEKNLSYRNLRNAKKQFQKAEKELTTDGNQRIREKSESLLSEENRIQREGSARLKEANLRQSALQEYQKNQAGETNRLSRQLYSKNTKAIHDEAERKIEKLSQEKTEFLDRRKAVHGVALEQIQSHYEDRQRELLDEQESSFRRIKNRVDHQINQNRIENSLRLEEDLDKSEDPFYQMRQMDADFEDLGRSYQLKVRIPEYERKGLKVQIVGQDLILSGMRSDHQKAVNEEGHEFSTSSFQNFSQKFKMDFPVDAHGMRISEEDGQLVYIIPKFGPDHPVQPSSRRPRITAQDFEMDHTMDFKNTLPLPSGVKKNG